MRFLFSSIRSLCAAALLLGGSLGLGAQDPIAIASGALDAVVKGAKLISALDDQAKGKIAPAVPDFKRNRNYFSIKNTSGSDWTLEVATFPRNKDKKSINGAGQVESGTIDIWRKDPHTANGVTWCGKLTDAFGTLILLHGYQYLLFPKFDGVLGSKIFATDFCRTLHLADTKGNKVDLRLTRASSPADAPTKLGYASAYDMNSQILLLPQIPKDPKTGKPVLAKATLDLALIVKEVVEHPASARVASGH